tara:strand:+ start:970 stop:1665 length:696 start_codon:yes stop_codon:yes gene_type:complete
MNKSDMKRLVDNLESLDALGKLFSNLWYPKVKAEIQDEKLRAYLTVFEDAIPGIGNVLQYLKQNADAIAAGDIDTTRNNLSDLADSLLNGESDQERKSENELDIELDSDEFSTDVDEEDNFTSNDLLSEEQQEALESVGQEDIEVLFEPSEQAGENQTEEIELDELLADDEDIEIDSDLDEITADISEDEMSSILEEHTSQGDSSSAETSNKKEKRVDDTDSDNEIDALFE